MAPSEAVRRKATVQNEPRWNIDELLGNARKLAAAAEPYPFNLTRCVRGVLSAKLLYENDQEKLLTVTGDLVSRVIGESPSLATLLYFSVDKLAPAALAPAPPKTPRDLATILPPKETLAVLCLGYLMRRLSRRTPKDEWTRMCQALYREVELACLLAGMFGVERSMAILFGSIRHLAFGCFLANDPRSFPEFKRHMRKGDWGLLTKEELRRYGCTHVQLASVLIIDSGFGVRMAEALHYLYAPVPEDCEYRNIAQLMAELDHLRFTQKFSPELSGVLEPDQLREFQDEATRLLEDREPDAWLSKRIDDLPPSVAQNLNIRALPSKQKSAQDQEEEPHE